MIQLKGLISHEFIICFNSLKSQKNNHKARLYTFRKTQKIARFYLMLARKNRDEISIFLFWVWKIIGTYGHIIYPFLIIDQINIPLKGEITYSREARVELAVSQKTLSFHTKPWLESYQILPLTMNLIYDSPMLQ